MELLTLDVGTSSVKAALFRNRRLISPIAYGQFATDFIGPRAEVRPSAILAALGKALAELGKPVRGADAIALSVMAPSWVAMDARGKPLTPIVTHQDRRSVSIAKAIEQRVGAKRHLRLTGNRPFPGGISSTTWAWFLKNAPQLMGKADLVGHLNTFLHRQLTAARVTDPSNASFMGLYLTLKQGGWSRELCEAAAVSMRQLPQVLEADRIAGRITHSAARHFGLTAGTPVLAGIMDGSCIMLLAGAQAGQLVDNSGSTDVLALCTDHPTPHERLLTRALGVGQKWLSVGTLAAAGSSLTWAREQLFADHSWPRFLKLVGQLATRKDRGRSTVCFDPYLAGDRTNLEQRQAAFTGLTLATRREDLLAAMIDALAEASAARIPLLRQQGIRIRHKVLVSGGVGDAVFRVLHRDWPGRWTFRSVDNATLAGLATLEPQP